MKVLWINVFLLSTFIAAVVIEVIQEETRVQSPDFLLELCETKGNQPALFCHKTYFRDIWKLKIIPPPSLYATYIAAVQEAYTRLTTPEELQTIFWSCQFSWYTTKNFLLANAISLYQQDSWNCRAKNLVKDLDAFSKLLPLLLHTVLET